MHQLQHLLLYLWTQQKEWQKRLEINSHLPVLKIKLGGGEEDLNRISLIRKAAPEAKIIIDANEGWSLEDYKK